jgi:hypothetical protein
LFSTTRNSSGGIWWLHPAALFGLAGCIIGIAAYVIPEADYRTNWRTPKFFGGPALEVTLACVAVFVFGTLLTSQYLARFAPRTAAPIEMRWDLVEKLFRVSVWLAVIGYVIWAGLAIQRGMTLTSALAVATGEKGAMYDARFTYLPTVGGVTTLTEFGTAAAIFGALLGSNVGWNTVRTRLSLILGLAILRALLNSERFAIIELVVPFTIALLPSLESHFQRASKTVRGLIRCVPVIGSVGLLFIFTGFEYFRSWSNYYAGRNQGLLEFGALRLLGYYVTSFNNGAYFLGRLDPLNAPYFTCHFLWGFPLSSPIIKRLFADPMLDSADKWFYFPFLESDANVEFNNADGMLFPLMDFGVAGGLLYWFAIALACGVLYYLYCSKTPLGLMMYPIVYLSLLEVPLALYWSEGRAFPSQMLLLLSPLVLWLARRTKKAPELKMAPALGASA